ncbi:MAG: hypothetical protein AAF903_06045 [Pseudomonadota bacterium]
MTRPQVWGERLTITQYIAEVEKAGGRLAVCNGSLFIGLNPDADPPECFWMAHDRLKERFSHIPDFNAKLTSHLQHKDGP